MIVRVTIEIEGEGSSEQLQSILRNLSGIATAPAAEPAPALAAGEAPAEAAPEEAAPKRRGRRPKGEAAPAPVKPAKKRRNKSSRPRAPKGQGVVTRVGELVGTPYFDEERRPEDVQAELLTRGYDVDVRQIYSVLKQLVDQQKLQRRKDDNNKYIYSTIS
ncbi:MAG: hypothetical protein KME04_11520 [Pleurocapsa minor GSE-CHR-MK-17-07R]|jgi:hypothetical protein|nr:hypothetical protein [Pleurocapsa minor GSE-CHR-MK 17-07R]